MPAKAAKKKDLAWDEIGKAIGKKIEKVDWEKCQEKSAWKKHHEEHGGGFGRLLFALGLLFALRSTGVMDAIPVWCQVLMVIGFALMKF